MFYKNVDIDDIESIMTSGILPLDECGNDNWDTGRRADNPTDVVYLFKPQKRNNLVMYGLLLLGISDDVNARQVEFAHNDHNADNYSEYVVDRVDPSQIVAIYAPEFLKDRICAILPDSINRIITWVNIRAYVYTSDNSQAVLFDGHGCGYREANAYEYSLMLNDSCNLSTNDYNYFRGIDDNKLVCDYSILDYLI